MKLLLTGGTGFIGSHLLAELLQAGHEVVAVRRAGSMPVIPLEQEPVWLECTFFELTSSDLAGVEAVIHLASAGVSPQKASWENLEKINIAASLRLIQLSHEAGVRRFIAAGTCHEYGLEAENWERIPPTAPLKPITPYGASKAAGFLMLQAFAIANQMELFYGRIFAAYGEGQFAGNLWPSLCKAALRGDNFPMTDGKQVSDFIPVKTVAKHLATSCVRSDIIAGKPFVVNIASGQGISVLEFAKRCWIELGSSGTLEDGALPNRPHQLARMVADTHGLHYPRNLEA